MSDIIQMKITLAGSKPPIWRRILVGKKSTFLQLHRTIQIAMGWTDSHLYEFEVGKIRIGEIDANFGFEDDDISPSAAITLKTLLKEEKMKFSYTYDFGDGWEHQILVEKFLEKDSKISYPTCVKGKMNCPPEDCGGVWGFEDLLKIINDKKHPEREERLEWIGGSYDPTDFSIEEKNTLLKRYL